MTYMTKNKAKLTPIAASYRQGSSHGKCLSLGRLYHGRNREVFFSTLHDSESIG